MKKFGSIKERKLVEKEEMSKRILDGARQVFLEKGYERTTMRNIAEEISYSPATLYFYYKDKGDIFHELHEEGFRRLIAEIRVLASVSDPFERLKAMGSVMISFALTNKDFYNLMFIVDEPSKLNEEKDWSMGRSAVDLLWGVVSECQAAGRFRGMEIEYLSFMILSSIHGICALFCKSRIQHFGDKTTEDLMRNAYTYFTLMLESI